jgi:hypothetical protein
MHAHKGVTTRPAISLSTRHDGAKEGEALMNARYERKWRASMRSGEMSKLEYET